MANKWTWTRLGGSTKSNIQGRKNHIRCLCLKQFEQNSPPNIWKVEKCHFSKFSEGLSTNIVFCLRQKYIYHSNSSGYNILWYSRSVKSCGGSPTLPEYLNQRSRWSSLIMVGCLLDRTFWMVWTSATLALQPLLYLISYNRMLYVGVCCILCWLQNISLILNLCVLFEICHKVASNPSDQNWQRAPQ